MVVSCLGAMFALGEGSQATAFFWVEMGASIDARFDGSTSELESESSEFKF